MLTYRKQTTFVYIRGTYGIGHFPGQYAMYLIFFGRYQMLKLNSIRRRNGFEDLLKKSSCRRQQMFLTFEIFLSSLSTWLLLSLLIYIPNWNGQMERSMHRTCKCITSSQVLCRTETLERKHYTS